MDETKFQAEIEGWSAVDQDRVRRAAAQMGIALGWCLAYRYPQPPAELPARNAAECKRIFEAVLLEWGDLNLVRSDLQPQDFVFMLVRRLAGELNDLMAEAPSPWDLRPAA